MTTLLLVDDEPAILDFMTALFTDAGFRIVSASDGVVALKEFYIHQPDLAIIDLMMPNMNGFELCKRIREVSHVPLIILTGLEKTEEKVQAFASGADDYVTKPVNGRELIARVQACLRRSNWPSSETTSSLYSDSVLTVDHGRREVYINGEPIELTPIEYSLLWLLVSKQGEALSLEYLLTNVWGKEYDTFDLVKWHISNLRKKISVKSADQTTSNPVSPIATVRGYGYRYEKQSD